ncbi:MAG: tight adherence protein [Pseudonocardiales bacterium]|nr:tight adherence protein [Pseudonocardiales bacterium]
MTWVGWAALAAAIGLTLMPSAAVARAGDLAGSGRLVGRGRMRVGWRWAGRVPWRWAAAATGAAAVGAVVVRGGVVLAVAAAAVLMTAGVLVCDVLLRRARATRHRALLMATRVLVAELEAGAQSGAALAAAAEGEHCWSGVFESAAAVARRGGDAGAVLAADEHSDVRIVGLAWQLGDATGAALAGVVGRVAADLAAADEQRRAVAVALAGPRSSASVLSGLPVLGIALGAAMGARPLTFLTGAPAGKVLCCVGVLLDVAGVFWMRRIVHRAERP